MANVTIYVKSWCPYSQRALALLDSKSIDYEAFDVEESEVYAAEMVERSNGRRTVPQVFIGDRYVGGCDDLEEANARGDLDTWLASEASV